MKRNVGKVVGGAVYMHRSAVGLLPSKHAVMVKKAEALLEDSMWNVVRVAKNSVSFLLYEQFEQIAFPALLTSAKVDVASGEVVRIDYRNRENPPILHRKELLLPPDDPRQPTFRALTAAAEEHGLFREPNKSERATPGRRASWRPDLPSAGIVSFPLMRSMSKLPGPPRLRVLVGSAEVLQGGVEASDFVEIDLEAPRIVMITRDDVERYIPCRSRSA
jgi:hypothetical protein